jgi:hypothetical protein
MTPNGAFAVGLALIALSMSGPGPRGIAILLLLAVAFAITEVRGASVIALRRAAMVVLPLAVFMGAVWVGIVGRSPAQIAAEEAGTRSAALAYVATICARLFFIVAVVQLVFLRFSSALTPLQFVRALALPAAAKRALILTLSLMETLRHSVDRAHTALIAAGTLTRAPSWRNIAHSWRLIQAAWLSAVTIVLGRIRDKWPVEHTLALLDRTLVGATSGPFADRDRIWLPVTVVAAIAILIADRIGGAS